MRRWSLFRRSRVTLTSFAARISAGSVEVALVTRRWCDRVPQLFVTTGSGSSGNAQYSSPLCLPPHRRRRAVRALLAAAIHFRPVHRAVEQNAEALLALVRRACGVRPPDVIVAPELALSGFAFESPEEMREYAVPVPCSFVQALRDLAAQYGSTVVAGLAEQAGGCLHNSAVVIAPGADIQTYRQPQYTPGYGWVTCAGTAPLRVVTPHGPISTVICADVFVRRNELPGDCTLTVPANWNDELSYEPRPLDEWQRLATSRTAPLIIANRYGNEMYTNGMVADFSNTVSCIIGSDGTIVELTTEAADDVIVGQI